MSVYTTTSGTSGILPKDYGPLIVEPVIAQALAFDSDVATTVRTVSNTFGIPVVKEDAGAAWVAEGEEISPDDPTLAEVIVTPAKVAGLTIVSREIAHDSSPAAQQIVGEGLARSIASKVDDAFFGDLATPAPKGLEALTGVTPVTIEAGGVTDLDVFAAAISQVESVAGTVTAFIANPVDALIIAQLKDSNDSNRGLLEDPRTVYGRPLKVSAKVEAGTFWAVDASRIVTVLREDTTLSVSEDAYFSSDRVAIRATMRVGFGFPSEQSIAKLSS